MDENRQRDSLVHLRPNDSAGLFRGELPPLEGVGDATKEPWVPPVDEFGRERVVAAGCAMRRNVERGPGRVDDLVP